MRAETIIADAVRSCDHHSHRLNGELRALNKRLDAGEHLAPIVRELGALNDSLQALAYAALGQQGPQVRRRAG